MTLRLKVNNFSKAVLIKQNPQFIFLFFLFLAMLMAFSICWQLQINISGLLFSVYRTVNVKRPEIKPQCVWSLQ